MTTQTRVPPGVPTGGRYTVQSRAESEVALGGEVGSDAEPEFVTVKDSSGDPIDLAPGVINDEAQWAYTHGQCLALAAAISRRTGWPVRTVSIVEREPDADEPGGYRENHLLRHATVLTPDGDLLDITGPQDPEAVECDDDEVIVLTPTADLDRLLAEHEGFLEEQNLAAAETFVQPVLDTIEADLAATDQQPLLSAAEWARSRQQPPTAERRGSRLMVTSSASSWWAAE